MLKNHIIYLKEAQMAFSRSLKIDFPHHTHVISCTEFNLKCMSQSHSTSSFI